MAHVRYGTFAEDEQEEQPGSTAFWWKLGFSVVLVLLGGVFAG
jgi:metal transporter CNNM